MRTIAYSPMFRIGKGEYQDVPTDFKERLQVPRSHIRDTQLVLELAGLWEIESANAIMWAWAALHPEKALIEVLARPHDVSCLVSSIPCGPLPQEVWPIPLPTIPKELVEAEPLAE